MIDSAEEAQIQQSYQKLIHIIFQEGRMTMMDKIDDYLMGINKKMPKIQRSTHEPQQKEKDEEVQRKTLESILNFPTKGVGALEEFIPGRPYSFLTLFCLLNDKRLIYALVGLGISVLDFDWVHHFDCLSEEVKLILKSIKKTQRNGEPLRIPRDLQRTFQDIQNLTSQIHPIQIEPTVSSNENRSTNPTNDISHQSTGTWVGEYFVEDYEQDLNQSTVVNSSEATRTRIGAQSGHIIHSTPVVSALLVPTPSVNLPQTSTTNHLKRKLNQLQSLRNQTITPIQQPSSCTAPSPSQSSSHPHPLAPHSNSINSSTISHPINFGLNDLNLPCYVQMSNLPIDASLQSILFFLKNGPDIFKTARTQNQKIDALGRNLKKFQNNFFVQLKQPKQNNGNKKLEDYTKKYSIIKETDIELIRNQPSNNSRGSQESRTINVKFDPVQYLNHVDSFNSFVLNFINDFHDHKFFPLDLFCPTISCKLIT